MIEVKQRQDEERLHYLVRVLHEFAHHTIAGEQTIIFDEAQCDMLCLAYDLAAELGLDTDEF